MDISDITRFRLYNQQISHPKPSPAGSGHFAAVAARKPAQLVAHMGALQAQDYPGALWAVGLRAQSTRRDVEAAIAKRQIIRSWPMRGTLHFVAAADARWFLNLTMQKMNDSAGWVKRRAFLGLELSDIEKCRKLITRALRGGTVLTREEVYGVMDRGGVSSAKQRGYHILSKLAHEQVICFGPHRGTEATFVLFDEWVPKTAAISRDEALMKLTIRYFTSHGPATVPDFGWWSGLKVSDIKAGIAAAGKKLVSHVSDGVTYWMGADIPETTHDTTAYLLPPFDEYMVSYKNRDAVIDRTYSERVNPGSNGMFSPIIVIGGQVVGLWKRTVGKKGVVIQTMPFRPAAYTKAQKTAVTEAAERYGAFLDLPVTVK